DCDDCDIRATVEGVSSTNVTGTVPGTNRVVINSVDLKTARLWGPANLFTAVAGSPALGTLGDGSATTNRQSVMLFDASATEVAAANFQVPQDWATFDVYLWWSNAGAGSGNVVWGGGTAGVETGETTNA